MRHIIVCFLILNCVVTYAQLTTPERFDFTTGSSFTIDQFSGNNYPQYFCIGVATDPNDGPFNIDLKTDAIYSNANNPGRWRDEGAKTMSYRGGSDELQQACFLFRGNVTGRYSISIKWTVRVISSNSNTNCLELQWKDGSNPASPWNDVSNDLFQQGTTTDPKSYSVVLPAAANNLNDLRIRWIYYEIGTGSRDRLALDDIVINTFPQPLPVELNYFKVAERDNKAWLSWQTLSEENSRTFIIEKSTDGENFKAIGEVPAQGTTSLVHNYEFTDVETLRDLQYYRLNQIDFNNTQTYSEVESIQGPRDHDFRVYPTLVSHDLFVDMNDNDFDKGNLRIFDTNGNVVYQQDLMPVSDPITVPASILTTGVYFVMITTDRHSESFRILKSF